MTDISGERQKLTAQGLDFYFREVWGARQDYRSDRYCEVPARALFLHISVTHLRANEHEGMREIESIGQSRFGIGCSYNAAVFPSGKLYEGQPLTRRGAHTINNHERARCPAHDPAGSEGSLRAPSWNNNVNGRALVLPQNVDDPVTDAQIDSAARWAAAQVRSGLAVKGVRWHGHRCVTAKDCPGGKGYGRIPELQRLTDRYVATGLKSRPQTFEEALMEMNAETRAQLVEAARLGAVQAMETLRPAMEYYSRAYNLDNNQDTLKNAAQHAAAQAIASVRSGAQVEASVSALSTRLDDVVDQLAELRTLLTQPVKPPTPPMPPTPVVPPKPPVP